MNNQEKILEIVEEQQRTFLGSSEANLHASEEIADKFRPRLTVQQVKEVFEQLFNEQILFSKATQILNGDKNKQV